MAKVANGLETLPKMSIGCSMVHERYRQTIDGRAMTFMTFTFANRMMWRGKGVSCVTYS